MSRDARHVVEQVADEAGSTRDEPMPPDAVAMRPNKSLLVTVRLAPEDVAAIEALAAKLDVSMSTLLRGWILTALAVTRDESVGTALDRLTADVQRLRELVS